jgi:signal transduction histidine kinase
MQALPSPVVGYLQGLLAQTRFPAFLLVDKQGHLRECGGDLSTYGLVHPPKGSPVIAQVPFLTGLLPANDGPIVCPCLEIRAGLFIDLHIFPGDDGDWVLLLDASADAGERRRLQQRVQELTLMLERQSRALRQHLVVDVFQQLDQFLRSVLLDPSLLDASLLAEVCAGLDILVLERLRGDAFRIVGSIPTWFVELAPADLLGQEDLQPGQLFPFLANFLIDAEVFWQKHEVGVVKSGPWRELDRTGKELYLEASAVRWGACQFLLIAYPRTEYEEKQAIIQKARENNLQRHHFQKEVQQREILLHCIVHDLGGPLMPIMACFSFLQRERLSRKGQQFVALGLRQATWQQMLIQDILDTFRAELGAFEAISTDPAQAPDAVICARAVAEALLPVAATKNTTLQVRPSPNVRGDWQVIGERSRLERVIFNLVENAIRHAPDDSVVTIDIRHDGPHVQLTVEDQGSGIPPDLVGRLFEKFSGGGTRRGSAGLGLYFCRITVERWGGTIGYAARLEGGSQFWVRLPRLDLPPPDDSQTTEPG